MDRKANAASALAGTPDGSAARGGQRQHKARAAARRVPHIQRATVQRGQLPRDGKAQAEMQLVAPAVVRAVKAFEHKIGRASCRERV